MFFWTMVLACVVSALCVSFCLWADTKHDEELFNISLSLVLISLFFTATIVPSYIMYKINGNIWSNINDVSLVLVSLAGITSLFCGGPDAFFVAILLVVSDFAVKYVAIVCMYIYSKFSHLPHVSFPTHAPLITFIFNFGKLTFYGFITSLIVTFVALMASMADRYEGGTDDTTITGTTYNFRENGSYNGFQTTSFNIPGNRGHYVGPGNPLTGGGLIAVFSWTMLIFYIVGFIYIYY